MKFINRNLLIGFAVAGIAAAQGPGHHGPGPGVGPMGPEAGMFFGHKVVTGAPYSADLSQQFTQTLADGNTINRSNSGKVARDSQGRTYSQETITAFNNQPKTITFISDPVAGYSYVLHDDTKEAVRRALPAARNGSGEPKQHPAHPDETVTDLGTQTINGVTATGKSITHTLPVGAMGNAQPIVSTTEIWTSTDLGVVVLSKHVDPRAGQHLFQLTNIQRSESAASLFQVPSDYKVVDGPKFGGPHDMHAPPPPPNGEEL